MPAGSGQVGDPAPAMAQAGSPDGSPCARNRLVTWHGDLVAWVDGLGWIRSVDDWLTAVLGPFRERHQDNLVLELLHGGRWVGHPLHPALSDLPIGLWTAALVLDVTVLDATDRSARGGIDPAPSRPGIGAALSRPGIGAAPPLRGLGAALSRPGIGAAPPLRGLDAAGLLSAAGLVAAGATALTGLTDWTVSSDQDRRVGLFHGLLNTAALGLQAASLGTRMAGHRGTARALGAAGLAVTVGAAYLGGHLVFARGVMVSRVAWAPGPRRWTRALPEADLPEDAPAVAEVEGRPVMLYRHDGTLFALDNLCSHAGGLLSRGTIADGTVTCPLHGSRFALSDGCVARGPASQPQPVLRTRIRNGWIEVRGSEPTPRRRATGRKTR
jgi:nitrite reductase/ring-hydroxylating ferredoxin subunit/uncharacterized membrane protein